MKRRAVVAGALGNCVHVAGVSGFLALAEKTGYEPVLLGPAVPPDRFAEAVAEHDAAVVGVSYRLTPTALAGLLAALHAALAQRDLLEGRRFLFGGTPATAAAARDAGWFERVFTGLETPEEVIACLGGDRIDEGERIPPGTLLERLSRKAPYPLLRHHFGMPSVRDSIEGVREIAQSGVVDVLSLVPDQNAQESFFRPEVMDPALDGAGGVPLRDPDDLRCLYAAGRCGNHPLLHIHSGTRDLLDWAQLATRAICNAWGTVPLTWYSVLDGRSNRDLAAAIAENQETMRWYARQGIPLEVNEAHHWSLRGAHDAVAVAMAYVAAYNARAMGVRHYVAPYMLNTPPGTDAAMDLARMLATAEMIRSLHNESFTSFRQLCAGPLHFSPDPEVAKGQLASSALLAVALRPQIIDVVGLGKGGHAAGPREVIESCKIVHGVLRNCLFGLPDLATDRRVQERKQCLLRDALSVIAGIRALGGGHPEALRTPETLALAVRAGIVDAPQLRGNPAAAGRLCTRLIDGAVQAVHPATHRPLSEQARIARLLSARANAAHIPSEGRPPALRRSSYGGVREKRRR